MQLKVGLEGDGRIIQIEGSLDLYNAQDATQIVRPLLEVTGSMIIVDLSGLESIDSSGIGMLFHWRQLVLKNGGTLSLRNVAEGLRRTLLLGQLNIRDE